MQCINEKCGSKTLRYTVVRTSRILIYSKFCSKIDKIQTRKYQGHSFDEFLTHSQEPCCLWTKCDKLFFGWLWKSWRDHHHHLPQLVAWKKNPNCIKLALFFLLKFLRCQFEEGWPCHFQASNSSKIEKYKCPKEACQLRHEFVFYASLGRIFASWNVGKNCWQQPWLCP